MSIEWKNKISELTHLSPSSASYILDSKRCKMRTVLSQKSNRPVISGIPKSGNTVIGNIIHNLYDFASSPNDSRTKKGLWTFKDAMDEFEKLCMTEEKVLAKNSIDAHLVPISDSSEYTVKMMEACRRAVIKRTDAQTKINTSNKVAVSDKIRLFGSEVWVWDLRHPIKGKPQRGDYTVLGKIDLVEYQGNELAIIDYKTGEMFQDDGKPKSEYVSQLKLYAILHKMTAEHCHGANIVANKWILEHGTRDEEICEKVNINECEKILKNAINKMNEINADIKLDNSVESVSKKFTEPSIENCRYCEFRVGCVQFREELLEWMLNEDVAVNDVIGKVNGLPLQQTHSSPIYQLRIKDKLDRIWVIDGIDSIRFPEVLNVKEGDVVAVFGGGIIENNLTSLGIDRFFKVHKRSHAFHVKP